MIRGTLLIALLTAIAFVSTGCGDDTEPNVDATIDTTLDGAILDGKPDVVDISFDVVDVGIFDGDIGPIFDTTVDGIIGDITIDAPIPDITVDSIIGDTTIDAPIPDITVDVISGDITLDSPTPDTTVDAPPTDTTVDSPPADTIPADTTIDSPPVPVPGCTFITPANGTVLNSGDNKNPGSGAFKYDVVVQTELGTGGTLELWLAHAPPAGTLFGSSSISSSPQNVNFYNVSLTAGQFTLWGKLTKNGTQYLCFSTIIVDITEPQCGAPAYNPATVSTPNGKALQDGDIGTSGVQTDVTIQTETGVTNVELNVGGTKYNVSPVGNIATFNLTFSSDGSYTLRATCTNGANGSVGVGSTDTVWVDTAGPNPITDLVCTVKQNRAGEIECTFTEPYDAGTGLGVKEYELRYLKNIGITPGNFATGILVSPNASAGSPGQPMIIPVSGMAIPNQYSYAIRPIDFLDNQGTVSSDSTISVDYNVQSIEGSVALGTFGLPVVGGDFNCDGLADIAVGVRGISSSAGRVEIFLSNGIDFPSTPDRTITGTEAAAVFGESLAVLDFNGDACDDLAVRASLGGASNEGRVYLYFGADNANWPVGRDDSGTGTGAEIIYVLGGTPTANDRFGLTIAGVDLNDDGHEDLAIGHQDKGADNTGDVYVDMGESGVSYMGPGISPSQRTYPTQADIIVTGGTYSYRFATVVGRGGFLDGDNYEELLIGSERHKVGADTVGGAYILKGDAWSGSQETINIATSPRILLVTGTAANTNTRFGTTVAGVGDIDGDGNLEFAVSDVAYPSSSYKGQVYIFDLGGSTPATVADAEVVFVNNLAAAETDYFGRTIANGTDLDRAFGADIHNDGFAEVIIGSYQWGGSTGTGNAYLFWGANPITNTTTTTRDDSLEPTSGGKTNSYSKSMSVIGDMNGDGFMDIVVGDDCYPDNCSTDARGRLLVFY